jgi:hypothetical protein
MMTIRNPKRWKYSTAVLLSASLFGCASAAESTSVKDSSDTQTASETAASTTAASYSTDDVFTDRDLEQCADTSEAETITVTSGEDITIDTAGTYVIEGNAEDTTIYVNAGDEDKVQLVLNGVSITNTDKPAVYVQNADKVFVTSAEGSENTLKTTGTFVSNGEDNPDAVIWSRDDLVFNGSGSLTIDSSANGISSHDDLKITGGTYTITSKEDALEGNDLVAVHDGSFTITTDKDGIHAENSDDATGDVYIEGGTFTINAGDDGIQGTALTEITGGTFTIEAVEGVEGTYVLINDGDLTIKASDDGINASEKSSAYAPQIEVNGGTIQVTMSAGDTDAFDANGSIAINGGTIEINANGAFDYDTTAVINGGTVTVNGEKITEIENDMPNMGGGSGPQQGQPDGQNGNKGGPGMKQF